MSLLSILATRLVPARVVVALAMAVLGSALAVVSAPAAAAPQDPPSNYDLALECRSALWKRTFDDATAAGLDPGAVVTSFDASAAERRDEGGVAVFAGREQYEPTIDVDAFAIRYECRIDPATRQVTSVSYVAVDAAGDDVPRLPVQLVKDARLVAQCRHRIEDRLDDEARRKGVERPSSDVQIAPADVTFRPATGRVDLEGRGRARYGDEYEWQVLIFTCRYDEKRGEATRSTHALETPLPELSLPAASRDALDACRVAVEDEVLADARQRGYRSLRRVVVELPQLATIKTRGDLIDVSGKGQFKLDVSHQQPTPLSFACVYDAAAGRVASASFEVERGSWTPSGEIASGRTETLRCESRGATQQQCPAAIRGNVRIVREFGRPRCEAYTNWIWSASGITVWDGCRAEFEYEAR